jgi:hypothetical protein
MAWLAAFAAAWLPQSRNLVWSAHLGAGPLRISARSTQALTATTVMGSTKAGSQLARRRARR